MPSQNASTSSSVTPADLQRRRRRLDEHVVGRPCPSARRSSCSPCRRSRPGRGSRVTPCQLSSFVLARQRAAPSRSSCARRRCVYRRRNVISTRSPIVDGRRVDVGQLALEAAAAVEVDDRGDHRRAEAEGEAVDGERGDRGRHVGHAHLLHLVDLAAAHADPRRRQVDEAARRRGCRRSRTSSASVRADGGAAGRSGSGRRGGSRSRKPRQVRNCGYVRSLVGGGDAVAHRHRLAVRPAAASVVRSTHTSQPSASSTTAIVWPGSARSSTSASSSAQWAVPVLPTSAARSSTTDSGLAPMALRRRLDGPGVEPGDDDVVDVGEGDAGALQRRGDGLLGERHVGVLAEALLPDLGVRRRRARASGRGTPR